MELFLSERNAILFIAKIGVILFMLIYIVFAAVIIRQVRAMTETLSFGFETQIKTAVFLHFVMSLAVLILALVIL